jgi:acyl-coenzyme A thioesterase PaaI-like protein
MLGMLNSYIMKAESSSFYLFILNQVLLRAIPFNKPHSIKVKKISPNSIHTSVPYRRKNFNHIKGIHACCIATVAEFSAGLLLIKKLDLKKYRFIMSNISIEYTYQAKTGLVATSEISDDEISNITEKLKNTDSILSVMKTEVKDQNDKLVAICETRWQIKDWSKVKTKL